MWSLKILEAFPSLTVRRSVGLFVEIILSELVRWVPSKDPIHIISLYAVKLRGRISSIVIYIHHEKVVSYIRVSQKQGEIVIYQTF